MMRSVFEGGDRAAWRCSSGALRSSWCSAWSTTGGASTRPPSSPARCSPAGSWRCRASRSSGCPSAARSCSTRSRRSCSPCSSSGRINAINFVDGLDGLAAGIVGIGGARLLRLLLPALRRVRVRAGDPRRARLGVLRRACALGFLPHNFNPARIFMGDTGSMLIGLLLASSVITLVGQVDPNACPVPRSSRALLPMLLPGRRDGGAAARPAAGRRPPHPRRAQPVRAGQAAPAPPPAGDGPLPAPRRAADVRAGRR